MPDAQPCAALLRCMFDIEQTSRLGIIVDGFPRSSTQVRLVLAFSAQFCV